MSLKTHLILVINRSRNKVKFAMFVGLLQLFESVPSKEVPEDTGVWWFLNPEGLFILFCCILHVCQEKYYESVLI